MMHIYILKRSKKGCKYCCNNKMCCFPERKKETEFEEKYGKGTLVKHLSIVKDKKKNHSILKNE